MPSYSYICLWPPLNCLYHFYTYINIEFTFICIQILKIEMESYWPFSVDHWIMPAWLTPLWCCFFVFVFMFWSILTEVAFFVCDWAMHIATWIPLLDVNLINEGYVYTTARTVHPGAGRQTCSSLTRVSTYAWDMGRFVLQQLAWAATCVTSVYTATALTYP